MEIKLACFLLPLATIIFSSCRTSDKKENNKKVIVRVGSVQRDTIELKETFNQVDNTVNEYLIEKLKPIRANFKRINSITNWTKIDKKELWETTEGGEAKFYYLNKQLEKITTRHYGETFQHLTEYYLEIGQLSFVLEKTYKYNRPIYYDSATMKEDNDTEDFNFEKSEIIEERSYFDKGELLHQLNNQDCGSPFAKEYLQKEENRIKEDFGKLIKLEIKK